VSKFTDDLMAKLGVKPEDVHLPAGGVAIFGRTGNGKSSLFYHSRFVRCVIVADTGSMAHALFATGEVAAISPTAKESPIAQAARKVEEYARAGGIVLLDSWSTLEQQHCYWFKRSKNLGNISVRQHGEIVGDLRDLALLLAQSQTFTVFNTTPGGRGKTPDGQEVVYPAGAITGYPSLSGMNAGSETILARWGNVWGMFQGHPEKAMPRGLYVPSNDIRPEHYAKYAPLKDPLGVIRDTTEKGIMAVPDRNHPDNAGRCFIDELLVEVAAKFPKKRPQAAAEKKPEDKKPAAAGK
jgi:hypothetical protein